MHMIMRSLLSLYKGTSTIDWLPNLNLNYMTELLILKKIYIHRGRRKQFETGLANKYCGHSIHFASFFSILMCMVSPCLQCHSEFSPHLQITSCMHQMLQLHDTFE